MFCVEDETSPTHLASFVHYVRKNCEIFEEILGSAGVIQINK